MGVAVQLHISATLTHDIAVTAKAVNPWVRVSPTPPVVEGVGGGKINNMSALQCASISSKKLLDQMSTEWKYIEPYNK